MPIKYIALGLTILTLIGCSKPETPVVQKPVLSVETFRLNPEPWTTQLSVSGFIYPVQEIPISSEISGLRIVEVLVDVGSKVKQGQPLAVLNTELLRLEEQQLKASLLEAKALASQAKSNHERVLQLEAEDAISKVEVLNQATVYQSAGSKVDSLSAKLAENKIKQSYGIIKAPFDGTISLKTVNPGQIVQINTEMFKLIKDSQLEWRAEIPLNQVAQIPPNPKVHVNSPKNSEISTIRTVSLNLDQSSRTKLAYVPLKTVPLEYIGMLIYGSIETDRSSVFKVPAELILTKDNVPYVQTVNSNDVVEQKTVTILDQAQGMVAVTSGLTSNDRLIKEGTRFVKEGDLVKVLEARK